MILLSRHFVVVRLAQWVVVTLSKSRRSPPTVTRTGFTSALVGRMVATIWEYVTLRPRIMEDFATNNTVLVLLGKHWRATSRGANCQCSPETDHDFLR